MAGFRWAYDVTGAPPITKVFFAKNTETLTKGDIANIDSGEVDLAVTTDAALAGAIVGAGPASLAKDAQGVITATDSTTEIEAIISPFAVYAVADANARDAGATLDISGATGAQTVAASSNTEFVVVETKKQAADLTYVMITPSAHYLAKT